MGCLQQKEHGGGGIQPLVPREAYQKYCQQRCEMKERDPKMFQECERSCTEDFEQQKQGGGEQGKGLQGGGDINDDEGEQWEEMREDMCEKSCLLQLGEGADDQQQQEVCESSSGNLNYTAIQAREAKLPEATKWKIETKSKAMSDTVKIEQEQQEQLEQQEQEQLEQEQQGQQEQGQQGQQGQQGLASILDSAGF